MQNIFNYESGIMSTISRLADSVTLGVLWVICSIPIFTIGSSSAAFYYAYNKCICQKTGYAWKTFFESFKSNFKQATKIWLIVLGLALILVLDFYLLGFMEDTSIWIMIIQTAIIVVMLVSVIWGLYLFPYLSRFEASNKTVMKNCMLILLANMPQSILLLVVFVISVIGFLCLPLLNLFIPTLYMVCANRIQERIFRKYMTPEELEAQLQPEQEEA